MEPAAITDAEAAAVVEVREGVLVSGPVRGPVLERLRAFPPMEPNAIKQKRGCLLAFGSLVKMRKGWTGAISPCDEPKKTFSPFLIPLCVSVTHAMAWLSTAAFGSEPKQSIKSAVLPRGFGSELNAEPCGSGLFKSMRFRNVY